MKVGMSSTIPIEVIIGAGHTPIDLNNVFITSDAESMVEFAEMQGYPRNLCSWIKGIHTSAIKSEIDVLIGIVQGDCSNTHAMMSVLENKNIKIIPFSYSFRRDYKETQEEIFRLENEFEVSHKRVIETKKYLDNIRKKLVELDYLTWKEKKVSGFENHLWLVSSSDFNSDAEKFEKELDIFLNEAKQRDKIKSEFRMGFLGVPPIITDIYDVFAELGIHVVFNEVQRQFSMPYLDEDIVTQYLRYTYPYDINHRLEDIELELEKRNVDGVISYSQAFCHRQIEEIIFKQRLEYPFLTVEGNDPHKMDARTKLRVESFLDMIRY